MVWRVGGSEQTHLHRHRLHTSRGETFPSCTSVEVVRDSKWRIRSFSPPWRRRWRLWPRDSSTRFLLFFHLYVHVSFEPYVTAGPSADLTSRLHVHFYADMLTFRRTDDWSKDAARLQGGEQVALGQARQNEPREMQEELSECTPVC